MNKSLVNVGVVGYGYWGPNLVRNFMALPSDKARVKLVCDARAERLDSVSRVYPSIATTTDYDAMIADREIDLIAVATPVSSHFALAQKAFAAGKHVLVEKPLAASVAEAEKLVALARSAGRKRTTSAGPQMSSTCGSSALRTSLNGERSSSSTMCLRSWSYEPSSDTIMRNRVVT